MEATKNTPMAKSFKWLMVMLIPLLSISLTSCGNENDKPDNKTNSDEVDSTTISRLWKQNASWDRVSQYFLLLADGTCRHSFTGIGAMEENGHRSYDETTKTLTTDCSNYMWQVSLITPDSWAGLGFKYSKSDSYTPLSDESAFCRLLYWGNPKMKIRDWIITILRHIVCWNIMVFKY